MAINGGTIMAYLELDTRGYVNAMSAATRQTGILGDSNASVAQKIAGLGQASKTLGTQLSLGLTLPIVGAGMAAGKAAISFESAFAGVRKTVDATEAEFARLEKSILDMTKVIPTSANELAGIMESAGQLGVNKENLTAFTRTIADLGVATNLTGQEAATMLAQYANVTSMDLSNIDRLGSVIVDLGNNTAATERDIVEMAQRLSGMASILHLTDAQTMGLSATMASLGINAEAGGSAASRTMAEIHRAVLGGEKSVAGFAKAANMSSKEFIKAFQGDPLKALMAFIDGLNATNAAGKDVYAVLDELGLSDIRVTDTLLRMAGAEETLATNINLASDAWQTNNALQDEAAKRYATTESKLQLAKNSLNRLMIALGDQLLPVVTKVADGAIRLIDSFAELDEGTQQTITTVALLLAGIGPVMTLLGGIIGLFTGPLGLVAAVGLGGAAIYGVVAAIAAFNRAEVENELKERFDGIKLSAEQVEAILQKGFTSPIVDYAGLTNAKTELEGTTTKLNELSEQLSTELFMVQMGVTTNINEIPAMLDSYLATAQEYLDKQESVVKLQVTSFYGGETEDSQNLLNAVATYYDGLNEQATAKGKAMREHLEAALADGVLSDAERETAAKLRSELEQILAEAALAETDAKRRELKYDITHTPTLDLESVREFNTQIEAMAVEELDKSAQIYELNRGVVFKVYPDEAEQEKEIAKLDERMEYNLGNIDGKTVELRTTLAIQTIQGFAPEIDAMMAVPAQALDKAYEAVIAKAKAYGIELSETEWFNFEFAQAIQTELDAAGVNGDIIPQSTRDAMQAMYQEVLVPHKETLETMQKAFDEAGEKLPEQYQLQLDAIAAYETALKGYDRTELAELLYDGLKDAEPQVLEAATGVAAVALSGVGSNVSEYLSVGADGGQGYVNGLLSKVNAAREAGKQLGQAGPSGIAEGQQSQSPSKVTRKLGGDGGDGYVLGMLSKRLEARMAGQQIAYASLDGIKEAAQIHSPSLLAADSGGNVTKGYVKGVLDGVNSSAAAGVTLATTSADALEKTTEEKEKAAAAAAKKRAAAKKAAAAAAAKAAEEAEAARQQAILDEIISGGERILAAEKGIGDSRIAQLTKQNEALMATIGATSVWYQDTTLDKELKSSADYWQQLQNDAKAKYEVDITNANDAQKDAAKKAYDERLEQLKAFATEEANLLKKQYDDQKSIALRWLNTQQEIMQQQLDAKREAAQKEDYEAELAALQKQLRQTKSAREQRELQEEIDRMVRDEALRQEELQAQQVFSGFDALRDAVNAGLIGLGDLTQDASLGAVSFGSAGLGGLDNITASQLSAVLGQLSQSATIASSGDKGNTYQIDLRGSTVRDDSDITRIAEAFAEQMRSIKR